MLLDSTQLYRVANNLLTIAKGSFRIGKSNAVPINAVTFTRTLCRSTVTTEDTPERQRSCDNARLSIVLTTAHAALKGQPPVSLVSFQAHCRAVTAVEHEKVSEMVSPADHDVLNEPRIIFAL